MKNNRKYRNRIKSFMKFYEDEFKNRLDAFEEEAEGLPPENEIADNTPDLENIEEEEDI